MTLKHLFHCQPLGEYPKNIFKCLPMGFFFQCEAIFVKDTKVSQNYSMYFFISEALWMFMLSSSMLNQNFGSVMLIRLATKILYWNLIKTMIWYLMNCDGDTALPCDGLCYKTNILPWKTFKTYIFMENMPYLVGGGGGYHTGLKKNSECWYIFHIPPPPWCSSVYLHYICTYYFSE